METGNVGGWSTDLLSTRLCLHPAERSNTNGDASQQVVFILIITSPSVLPLFSYTRMRAHRYSYTHLFQILHPLLNIRLLLNIVQLTLGIG